MRRRSPLHAAGEKTSNRGGPCWRLVAAPGVEPGRAAYETAEGTVPHCRQAPTKAGGYICLVTLEQSNDLLHGHRVTAPGVDTDVDHAARFPHFP